MLPAMIKKEICYLCNSDCSQYSTLSGSDDTLIICRKCTLSIINLMRIPNIKCGSCQQLFHKDEIEVLQKNRKICMYCVKNKQIQVDTCYCCGLKYSNFDFAIIDTYTNAKYCLPCMQLFSLLKYDDLVDAVIDTN